MSPRDLNELEQLDALAAELTEAGHIARLATIHRERPEPEFSMRLRAELMRELPSHKSAAAIAPIVELGAGAPMPPVRPLDPAGRRHDVLPFVGTNRRAAASESGETIDVISGAAMEEAERMRPGKRWVAASSHEKHRSHDLLGLPLVDQAGHDAEDAGRITALKPSMRWHIPTRVMPSRWIAVGLAASVAAVSVFYGGGLFFSTHGVDTANEANAATLVRGGVTSALAVGMDLHQGDEIKVGENGRAVLQLGHTYVRMAGGSDVALMSLAPDHTVVSQVTGRVYHRASVQGGDYEVQTATVTWKADATAFDLNREFTAGGGEQVLGMALYDAVAIKGPQIATTLDEGDSATVVLTAGGAAGQPVIAPTAQQALVDDWLISNAGIDSRLGLPLGQLAAVLSPEPTPSATPLPTVVPTLPPTAAPTVAPVVVTPRPTPKPTPKPTPRPTPTPTPWGYLGNLTAVHNSDGTYTFSWPKYKGSGFQYYKLMHAVFPAIPNYGHVGDYWACPSVVTETTWTGSIAAGDYNVRVQVIDASSTVKAQTPVIHLTVAAPATLPPTVDLGPLGVVPNGGGSYTFHWAAYTGGPFSYYKLVYEPISSGKTPSYPGGSAFWAVPVTGATSATVTIPSGNYKVRIQAIGYPTGPPYAYGQTTVIQVTVP
jgi:hypothetical protein